MANEGYEVKYKSLDQGNAQLEFTIGDFNLRQVNLDGQDFTRIIFDGRVTTKDKGFAALPFVNANVQLDPVKNVHMEVTGQKYTDYQLDYPLVPSRGVIYRDQDPSTVPYTIAPESLVDEFYPGMQADITRPYIIKDVRGTTVYVYPFQYNAVTKTLRVYNEITVELTQENSAPVNPLYTASGKVFRQMEGLYQSVFINYENTREDLTIAEAGDILVICTARDEDAIQPYIDWKREKGYEVFKEVVATGTNVKSLIQQKYDENNEILYVQLVGDWADIKCDLGGGANAPMDPMLGCVVGTDAFPDISIGRFPAGSAADVTTQVNKTITYEKNPGGDWYTKAIGVASNQGPGDDNELDYEQINVIFNNKLDPFTYDEMNTAYDPTGTAAMVTSYIEQGASVINYCGHGSMTSWGSTGFSNSNVNQLSNGDMLPFIFSVACVNGAFHSGECFAEAWLKKENGGAIMTLMSTINQPWDPPMRGQDYCNDVLTGGYDYNSNPGNGISTDEGRTIIGSIVTNGLVLMYTESNQSEDLETLQTWTTFGDASLQVRTAAPEDLSISNNVMLVGSPFETTVTAGGNPVEGALVALSQDGIYSSAYTDASGNVSVPNEFQPGDVQLVVTAFNCSTIYETIQSVPPTGPYVIFSEAEVDDAAGNGNGMLDFGETAALNVALKNVGVAEATNVEVTLASTDEYVTITDATENYGTIAADEIKMVYGAFEVEIADNVPDGHGIMFTLTAIGEDTWESSFSLTAHAGIVEYGDYYIVDTNGNNNGKLDPGETVDLYVSIENNGTADVSGVVGELTSNDTYVSIDNSQASYGAIAAGESGEMSFTVTADAATPTGHAADFNFGITADLGLTGEGSFMVVVGQIPVLIVDMDENNNSANVIAESLDAIGITYEEALTLPADLNLYSSVFVCLGIYSDNHVLSDNEGQALADYLNAGGNLYMEGGDTWYYDDATAVHPMFGINGTTDGSSDLGTIEGVDGTFTEGLSFGYNGDNNYIDHLEATGDAEVILNNLSPAYATAIANDGGSYKTIGASHEFGGLTGARNGLMEAYLNYFGLMPGTLVPNFNANVTEGCEGLEVEFSDASAGATSWSWTFPGGTPETSTEQNPTVVYNTAGNYDVTLEISDGTETNTITRNNFISVLSVPEQAGPISGEPEVAVGTTQDYQVDALDDCTLYDWVLTPAEAGTLDVSMNVVTITFSDTWNGNAMLKVCGGNDCGMGEYSEDFEVMVYDPTGIGEITETTAGIYPNPSNGQFRLELSAHEAATYQVSMLNALGIEVYAKTIEVSGTYSEEIDLNNLAEGIYYLYLKNDNNSMIKKVIIRK